jgi:hypothetical protein
MILPPCRVVVAFDWDVAAAVAPVAGRSLRSFHVAVNSPLSLFLLIFGFFLRY